MRHFQVSIGRSSAYNRCRYNNVKHYPQYSISWPPIGYMEVYRYIKYVPVIITIKHKI
ncbi:MAG: hypothetical protein QXY17_01610 [Candidatus Micrarchaeia archaeon]